MKRRTMLSVGLPVVVVAALLLSGISGRERALAALGRVEIGRASCRERVSPYV